MPWQWCRGSSKCRRSDGCLCPAGAGSGRGMKRATLLTAAFAASAAAAPPPAPPRLEIAITMDDFPVHGGLPAGETRLDVARAILRAFKDAGVPEVYGFVNGARMNEEPGLDRMLQTWRAAGYPLGNHG